jgi:hypothetical protein
VTDVQLNNFHLHISDMKYTNYRTLCSVLLLMNLTEVKFFYNFVDLYYILTKRVFSLVVKYEDA